MAAILIPIIYLLVFGVPLAVVSVGFFLSVTWAQKLAVAALGVPVFFLLYLMTAGALARLGLRSIVPGVFPRELKHPVYGPRELYLRAWSSLRDVTPIYRVVLAVPFLRTLVLRLFGYSASTRFTLCAGTRLPEPSCVKFEEGARLDGDCSISTSADLSDGKILVDLIRVGRESAIESAVLSPGATVGERARISPESTLGIRAVVKDEAKIGFGATLAHGAVLGAGSEIGEYAWLGVRSRIGDGVRVPAAASIPAGTSILTQAEMDRLATEHEAAIRAERRHQLASIRHRLKSGTRRQSDPRVALTRADS